MPPSSILYVLDRSLEQYCPPSCASLHNKIEIFRCRILCGRNHLLNKIAQFTDYITFIAYKTCFLPKFIMCLSHLEKHQCVCICMYVCIYVLYVCMYTCIYVRKYARVCVLAFVRMMYVSTTTHN